MTRDRTTKQTTKRLLLLRACPRCHGDLFPDEYEEDLACLQCGRRFDAAIIAGRPETLTLAA